MSFILLQTENALSSMSVSYCKKNNKFQERVFKIQKLMANEALATFRIEITLMKDKIEVTSDFLVPSLPAGEITDKKRPTGGQGPNENQGCNQAESN